MRVDIKAIMADPAKRRALMIRAIVALQAREGIDTTEKQAAIAYLHASMKRKQGC